MGKAEILQDLREKIEAPTFDEREYWSLPQYSQRVAKGILVEVLGNARVEWLLELFAANPDPYILWCQKEGALNPTAIKQRGVNLERIKFVHSRQDLQQPIRMALECGHYAFVVAPNLFTEIRIFQRLSLIAHKTQSTLFLLPDHQLSAAWPIALQLNANFSPNGICIETVRSKVSIL